MRSAYAGGAPGIFASGLVWMAAGLTAMGHPFRIAFLVFFFGGMAIQPLAIVGSKLLKRAGAAGKGNPLNALAIEGTCFLFAGLFVAWWVSRSDENLFFPIMLLTIGARYATFATLYGERLFWVLGGCLAALGIADILWLHLPSHAVAIAGSMLELGFAVAIFRRDAAR